MTENQISLSSSKEVEEAHIATVEQQIAENERAITAERIGRISLKDRYDSDLKTSRERETMLQDDQRRLRAKARVFRRAKFQIEEIDRQ